MEVGLWTDPLKKLVPQLRVALIATLKAHPMVLEILDLPSKVMNLPSMYLEKYSPMHDGLY